MADEWVAFLPNLIFVGEAEPTCRQIQHRFAGSAKTAVLANRSHASARSLKSWGEIGGIACTPPHSERERGRVSQPSTPWGRR